MSIKKYSNTKGEFWEAFAYCGTDDITGKEIREHKKGFKTKKEAQKWVENIRVSHRRGEVKKAKIQKAHTFKEVAELWLEQHSLVVKPTTVKDIHGILERHIYPQLGDYKISLIRPAHCQRAVNYYYKAVSGHKRICGYTKTILSYAVKMGYITINPMANVEIPKAKRKSEVNKKSDKRKFLSVEELNLYLQTAKDMCNTHFDSRWLYAFFRLLAYTGMRGQEVRALTWKDLYLDDEEPFVDINKAFSRDLNQKALLSTTKNETSAARIAIDSATADILREWRAEQREWLAQFGIDDNSFQEQFVFMRDDNKPLTYAVIRNRNNLICKRAGIEPITVHGFRHTHCTHLLNAGVPIKDTQKRLRHANINTTLAFYAHANENQKEVVNTFISYVTNAVTN